MIVLADQAQEFFAPGCAFPAADALLPLPLDEKELLARVGQLMVLPSTECDDRPAIFCFEGCRLDLAGHTFVDARGREVRLTRSEFALLTAFVRNPQRVLSRDQLRRTLAGHSLEPFERSVDVLVGRLRRKIEPDAKAPQLIATVLGAGYKLTVRPHVAEESARQLLSGNPEDRTTAAPPDNRGQGHSVAASRPAGALPCHPASRKSAS